MTEPERSGGFTVQIDGRTVVVRTGTKSQTVNICTPANVTGQYEERFRLDPVDAVRDESTLLDQGSLDGLRTWLGEHGDAEGPSGAPRPTPTPVPADPSDPWVEQAVAVVDAAIDRLIESFVEEPFQHRVEHSLHTELMTALCTATPLDELAQIGSTTFHGQLVQKEWPETAARKDRGKTVERRGLFDLAVLSPNQLAAASLGQFRRGLIAPSVVIELGLDYGIRHLDGDIEKFENSAVLHGRVVHLSRKAPGRKGVESRIDSLGTGTGPVRVAYGLHDPDTGAKSIKLLGDPTVRDLP